MIDRQWTQCTKCKKIWESFFIYDRWCLNCFPEKYWEGFKEQFKEKEHKMSELCASLEE
jgi:hypothetical protein